MTLICGMCCFAHIGCMLPTPGLECRASTPSRVMPPSGEVTLTSRPACLPMLASAPHFTSARRFVMGLSTALKRAVPLV